MSLVSALMGKKDDNAAKDLVLKRYNDFKDHEWRQVWYLNLAFYTGDQWVIWDKYANRLTEPPAPEWRVRMVDNQIQPLVRKEHAKLTKSQFQWQVFGATGETKDQNAAKAGQRFLDAKWKEVGMDNKRSEVTWWQVTCGTAFIKTWFNVDKGPLIWNSYTGNEQTIGDIDAVVCSPYEIIQDPYGRYVDDCRWIIHAKGYDVDLIEEIWGVSVKPERVENDWIDFKNRAGLGNYTNENKKNSAMVLEYWERPSKKYKQGRLVIVAGERLLYSGPNPTPAGDLPFADFRHLWIPGCFWGGTSLEQAIPHQKQINKLESQIQEWKNKTARPLLLLPRGSGINKNMITSAPGQILEYNGQTAPSYLAPPPMPREWKEDIDRSLQSMYNIFGQHEVSHGTVPEGVKSGVGIRYLQEQDDTMLGPTAHSIVTGWERFAKLWLAMAREEYDEPRQLKYLGANKQIEVMDFQGSDLTGAEDIEVIPGSILPESRAARQEFLMGLYKLGAFVDKDTGKPDNDRFLKMLELGGSDELFDQVSMDINAATVENRHMLRGEYQSVHEWENHGAHIFQHNQERKGYEFSQAPDEIKNMFKRHIDVHMAAQAGQMLFNNTGEADEEAFARQEMQRSQMQALMSQLPGPQMPQGLPPDMMGLRPQTPQGPPQAAPIPTPQNPR